VTLPIQFNKISLLFSSRISRNVIFWILFSFFHYYPRNSFLSFFIVLTILSVFYGLPVYFNNLYLIPKLFLRNRLIKYFICLAVLILIATLETKYINLWIGRFLPPAGFISPISDMGLPGHIIQILLLFAVLAIGKFAGDAIELESNREKLMKNNLEAELDTLKSQVNPHFLFNALNTIYGMARRTDPETAEAVMQLSGILRHNLYEGSGGEILLSREVEVLNQYIEFNRLRIHENDRILMNTDSSISDQKIAPMLLLPFVENAFKHGLSQSSGKNWITVDLKILDKEFFFRCANSAKDKSSQIGKGIGLKNAKRRLELCYPESHILDIHSENNQFIVDLKIKLK
jgi:hypothetical protein